MLKIYHEFSFRQLFACKSKTKEDINMKFGQRLKEIRLSKNLTMTDVEARAGLKVGNISRIEKGTQWVSEDSLHAIAQALDVQVATLFTEGNFNSTSGYITFQRLNVQASAGSGSEPVEYPDVLQEIRVLESWARQTLGVVDPSRVKIITCKGDSMTPTVRPGDIVFVDVSVRHFQAEGIYVLAWQNQLLLKRLNALFDGRLAIQSDNETNYKTEYVKAEQSDQLTICGRVLGWWTLRKSGM